MVLLDPSPKLKIVKVKFLQSWLVAKPIVLPLFLCSAGSLPTNIEIKIILSIPNTISREVKVTKSNPGFWT